MKQKYLVIFVSMLAVVSHAKTYECVSDVTNVRVNIEPTEGGPAKVSLKSPTAKDQMCEVAHFAKGDSGKIIMAFVCGGETDAVPELIFLDPETLLGRIEFASIKEDLHCL